MNYTSAQLSQCQKHDPRAQQDLYALFKARVMGICRRYTRNLQEAEDVFQDTFIRVFQSIHQLNDVGNLEPWICRIAVNAAINYYHKIKRHNHAEEKNGHKHQDGEYELILSRMTDEMLVNMVNELPDRYRMVFNLHVVEGYAHGEIAQMLQISESTSRSQLNRARHLLRNKLSTMGIIKYEKYA